MGERKEKKDADSRRKKETAATQGRAVKALDWEITSAKLVCWHKKEEIWLEKPRKWKMRTGRERKDEQLLMKGPKEKKKIKEKENSKRRNHTCKK